MESIEIYSNKILFDDKGFMYFDDQFFNKREETHDLQLRDNLILVGDNLGDNFMAEHSDDINYISFCLIDQNLTESNPYYKQNDRIKERLKTNVYDIVIKDDANLDLVPLLIHYCNFTHEDYLVKMDEPSKHFYSQIIAFLDSDDQLPYDSYFRYQKENTLFTNGNLNKPYDQNYTNYIESTAKSIFTTVDKIKKKR